MMTLLLILTATSLLTCGFVLGAHWAYLVRKVDELYTTLRSAEHEKNSGVVRPKLFTPVPTAERKSSVVRPRPPKTDQDETNVALNAVRNRV